jgi:tRNA (cmo5U34)-methyltransferase
MNQEEIKALFDQQAASYETQWAKTAPIRNCLHLLLEAMFAELPSNANVLCVGVGTGVEIAHLASRNPGWRFTAVEPSGSMLDICRQRAESEGFVSRCVFHQGYLETLSTAEAYDAATCFLVSQFILQRSERVNFFNEIARKLKPEGLLASSDLAGDIDSLEYEVLLRAWMSMMSAADISAEAIERMRKAYATDVGVLPPAEIASIIKSAGFELPVQFFQAGLIHAWLSKRV